MNLTPATVPFEFADGHKVELSLSFRRMYTLKSSHKDVYSRLNSVLTKGTKDIFDNITVLYAAYLCGHDGAADTQLSEAEFIDLCPADIAYVSETVQTLIDPKKRTASAARLRNAANGKSAE